MVCCDGSRTLRFRRDGDGAWQWVDDVSFPLDARIFLTTIGKVFTNADNENKGATVVKEEETAEV